MGFIGWRFFSDDSSADALGARRDLEASEAASERRSQKLRKQKQEARRLEKQRIRDEQYQQTQAFQEQFNKSFGSSTPSYVDPNDPSGLYKIFDKSSYKTYQEETARRYGYQYNSYTDGEAPKLSRGMGPAHHQGVNRPQNVKHHAPLGPLAKKIRISIGWQPNGGQSTQNATTGEGSSGPAPTTPGAFSGKLTRPL